MRGPRYCRAFGTRNRYPAMAMAWGCFSILHVRHDAKFNVCCNMQVVALGLKKVLKEPF